MEKSITSSNSTTGTEGILKIDELVKEPKLQEQKEDSLNGDGKF